MTFLIKLIGSRDGLSGKGFEKNVHSSAKTEPPEMWIRSSSELLLDVVVRGSAAIVELLSGKDRTLLIRRNSFLVLDLGHAILNQIGGNNIKSHGLSGEDDLHKNLK